MSDRANKVRMVLCVYGRDWVPMGRSRCRCPRCGAVVEGPDAKAHPVQMREPAREIGSVEPGP